MAAFLGGALVESSPVLVAEAQQGATKPQDEKLGTLRSDADALDCRDCVAG